MCQEEINDDGGKKAGATDGPDGPVVVDQRTRIKKFNEMTAPLYELLHKVEDVKLHSSILEPEPKDMKSARSATNIFNLIINYLAEMFIWRRCEIWLVFMA